MVKSLCRVLVETTKHTPCGDGRVVRFALRTTAREVRAYLVAEEGLPDARWAACTMLYAGPGTHLISSMPIIVVPVLVPRFLSIYHWYVLSFTKYGHQSSHDASLTQVVHARRHRRLPRSRYLRVHVRALRRGDDGVHPAHHREGSRGAPQPDVHTLLCSALARDRQGHACLRECWCGCKQGGGQGTELLGDIQNESAEQRRAGVPA
ncbi:uncharacterized protein B0H18DRAFT_74226 [Fomitopsis serialis]|uniref:uncharacterized protein n=1 Tax=Fomitopsis serialis TaxID=139415 RepID=UPI0020078B4C|nr:uncharacterized protein B0H18DRAFT_74226 [Neoantrodia serialis]KAH9916343.1 hypothetical protein B0H18DRAFT_74226 [Neoantrodia serialis]